MELRYNSKQLINKQIPDKMSLFVFSDIFFYFQPKPAEELIISFQTECFTELVKCLDPSRRLKRPSKRW